MNPRLGPTSKNGSCFQGKKMVVFPELNGETPTLINNGEKSVTANYDLSLLDVVPAKSVSTKTKHVHFLPDKSSVSPTKLREQYGNSTKSVIVEKSENPRTISSARKGAKELTASQSSISSYGSIQSDDDDHSETTDASFTKHSGKRISTKHSSSPKLKKSCTSHRSYSLDVDETNRAQNVDNDYQKSRKSTSKESTNRGKAKSNRSLPSTPAKTTKTPASSPSARESRQSKHKSPTGTKKDIFANPNPNPTTVSFADPELSSCNHEDKSRSNNDFNSKYCLLKDNSKQSSAISEKEIANTDRSGNVLHSLKSSLPIRRKLSTTEDNFRPMKLKDTTTSTDYNQSNQCIRTKYVIPSTSNIAEPPSSNNFIGWHSRLDQSNHDSNYANPHLTNQVTSSNLSSALVKRIDQSKNDTQPEVIDDIQSLTSPSSSSSLNKTVQSLNMYDLSSVLSTVFSKQPRHDTMPTDFKQMSASTTGALSSTSSTSKIKPRRSASCLDTNCIYRNGLDCNIATNLAQNGEKPANSPSPAIAGKHRVATLSDLERNSSSALVKKFDQSLLPFSSTKYRNLASVMRKQSIAASYHLDYCWFCGRPMPTFGISGSGQDDLLQKMAELEHLLAEAAAEKKRLLEEQAKLRNSKMAALKKNEALEKELEQIKMKENKEQEETRPVSSALPHSSKDFDLRAHLESSGHQLEVCPHIVVSRNICRGFLHKIGGRFRLWRKMWFVLDMTRRMVLYFTDKTETKLKGSICFQAIDEVYVDHLRIVKSPNPKQTFCVKTCERTYQLLAPSSDTMTIWVDALFSAAEGYQRMFGSCEDESVENI